MFDRHRYPPVPAATRSTCRVRGCWRHPTLGNSTTADLIAFKFGVFIDQLAMTFAEVRGEVHLHVRTCTSLFDISRTTWRIDIKFDVWLGTHSMSLTQVRCGVHLHVRTCRLLLHVVPLRSLVHRRSRRPTGVNWNEKLKIPVYLQQPRSRYGA